MRPLDSGENSNLLPTSNTHSDNGTFHNSNSLSKQKDDKISNSLGLIKLVSFIGLLILSTFYIYHGIHKNPSHIDNLPQKMFSFENGTRIQFQLHTGQYLRVDNLRYNSLVLSDIIPWSRGSTFELHISTNTNNNNNCYYFKSAAADYISINSMGKVSANAILKEATPIAIIGSEGDLTSVKLQVCKSARDYSLLSESKISTRKSSEEDKDSNSDRDLTTWLAFPTALYDRSTETYAPSMFTTSSSELSNFNINVIDRIKGVNLGGWFIPEVWMSRSIYNDTGLNWAGSLCKLVSYNRDLAEQRMQNNLDTWFTETDFVEMASLGINSIRIPIGYWNIIEDPYKLFAPADYKISLKYIDAAFNWAAKYGMSVLIDLHGAPGSQNGIDHSGCSRPSNWTSVENQILSLKAIQAMVDRYGDAPNLYGFELLNEPSLDIERDSHDILLNYYQNAYKIIRKKSRTAMVIFNELYADYYNIWDNELLEPSYYNIIIDYHLYNWQQPYTDESKHEHIKDAKAWGNMIDEKQRSGHHPILVGEWSMSTGIDVKVGQKFVDASIKSFYRGIGYYLWTWKVQPGYGFSDWDLQLQSQLRGNGDYSGFTLHANEPLNFTPGHDEKEELK